MVNFLFPTASRPALRTIQPPIPWVPEALSLVVKRPGREADHHLRLVRRSRMWRYTSTPPIRLHGVVLSKKHTGTTLPLPLHKLQHRTSAKGIAVSSPLIATYYYKSNTYSLPVSYVTCHILS